MRLLLTVPGKTSQSLRRRRAKARVCMEPLKSIPLVDLGGCLDADAARTSAASRADNPDLLAEKPLQGPNQRRDVVPDFRPRIGRYIAQVDRLACHVVRLAAMSLGLPAAALGGRRPDRLEELAVRVRSGDPVKSGLGGGCRQRCAAWSSMPHLAVSATAESSHALHRLRFQSPACTCSTRGSTQRR